MEAPSRIKNGPAESKLANKSISTKYVAEAANQTLVTILHMHIAGEEILGHVTFEPIDSRWPRRRAGGHLDSSVSGAKTLETKKP
jgi:hypothetical protein